MVITGTLLRASRSPETKRRGCGTPVSPPRPAVHSDRSEESRIGQWNMDTSVCWAETASSATCRPTKWETARPAPLTEGGRRRGRWREGKGRAEGPGVKLLPQRKLQDGRWLEEVLLDSVPTCYLIAKITCSVTTNMGHLLSPATAVDKAGSYRHSCIPNVASSKSSPPAPKILYRMPTRLAIRHRTKKRLKSQELACSRGISPLLLVKACPCRPIHLHPTDLQRARARSCVSRRPRASSEHRTHPAASHRHAARSGIGDKTRLPCRSGTRESGGLGATLFEESDSAVWRRYIGTQLGLSQQEEYI